jgi:hypothetical protein
VHQVGFIYKHISRFSITRTKLYMIWNTCTLVRGHVTVLRFIGACKYQNTAFLLLLHRGMAQAVSRWPDTAKARLYLRLLGVGFMVDKVAVEQVFLRVHRVSLVSIIPPMLHANSFSYHQHLHIPSNLKRC